MSAHRARAQRLKTRHAEDWYSDWHPCFDEVRGRGKQLAPMVDIDTALHDDDEPTSAWLLYDRGKPVALLDIKFRGPRHSECWTLIGSKANGLRAIARQARGNDTPAFVLILHTHELRFGFVALNGHAVALRDAFREWHLRTRGEAIPDTESVPAKDGSSLPILWLDDSDHWHFEMFVRARFAGRDEHDAAEVDRRVATIRAKCQLPQSPPHPITMDPYTYSDAALSQYAAGVAAAPEPTAFYVDRLRDSYSVQGRMDAIAVLDELERVMGVQPERARIANAPERLRLIEARRAQATAQAIRQVRTPFVSKALLENIATFQGVGANLQAIADASLKDVATVGANLQAILISPTFLNVAPLQEQLLAQQEAWRVAAREFAA